MSDDIVINYLETEVPWQCGNEKGAVTIKTELTGPESVVKAISKEIAERLKRLYGVKSRISRGQTQ